MLDVCQCNSEVLQNSILQIVDQAMDSHLLSLFPCLLDTWHSGNVVNLVLDVELSEFVPVLLLAINELLSINGPNLSDV